MINKVLVVVLFRPPEGQAKVLCLKRPGDLGWQSVTGKVEEGEGFEEGALREAIEETGLKFSCPPQYLGLEQSFEGRWGPAFEKAFLLECKGSPTPPQIRLDPQEHEDYEWLLPEEAMQRVKFAFDKEAICRAAFPPSPLRLLRDGTWMQDNEVISHERTIRFLHQNLCYENDRYKIKYGQEALAVVPDDCGRFIKNIHEDGTITLLDERRLPLNPETLEIGSNNVLYCMVNGERALFLRTAYYEIMLKVQEQNLDGKTQYILNWFGRDYQLRVPN